MKRVLISGYYGFGNLGDEVLLRAIVDGLRELHPNLHIIVASGDPQRTAATHGVEAIPRARPLALLGALRRVDLVISGGGSLLQDVTGPWNIPYYAGIMAAAQAMGVPVMVFAQGIGPIRGALGRRVVRAVVGRAAAVTVRDEGSRRLLEEMGVRRPIEVVADPVFALRLQGRQGEAAGAAGVSPRERRTPAAPGAGIRVGVALRRRGLTARDPGVLAEALDLVADRRPVTYVFFPMHPQEDVPVAEAVAHRLRAPVEVRRQPLTLEELAGLASACDLVLGMRLHALIIAALVGCPVAGISYDPKVDEFLREIGRPPLARLPGLPAPAELARRLVQEVDERGQAAAVLPARIDALRRRARRAFQVAGALLGLSRA